MAPANFPTAKGQMANRLPDVREIRQDAEEVVERAIISAQHVFFPRLSLFEGGQMRVDHVGQ